MSEVARELLSLARHGDGGTVPVNGMPLPSSGYYVGGRIPSLVMDRSELDRRDVVPLQSVINFVSRAQTWYVGVWADGDKIYFDAVEWYQEEHTAAAIGRVRREIAIWDVARSRELRLAYVDGE